MCAQENFALVHDNCAAGSRAEVRKHLTAARCWSVKKLLPDRAEAEPRQNWTESDWNGWHKEHKYGCH